MKAKTLTLLRYAGGLNLALGSMILVTGCMQEEPKMPPGVYVAKTPVQQSAASDKTDLKPASQDFSAEPVAMTPASVSSTSATAAPLKTEDKVHVVVKGDSLWKLARNNGLTIEELAGYNNISANARLKIGQKLLIPLSGRSVKSSAATTARKSSAKATSSPKKSKSKSVRKSSASVAKQNIPADGVYVVKAGDNFSTIAKRHGIKVADIIAANPGVNSSRLKVGQKLQLKSGAAVTASAAPLAAATPASTSKTSAAAAKKDAKETGDNVSANKGADDVDSLLNGIDNNTTAAPKTGNKTEAAPAAASVPKTDDVVMTKDNGTKEIMLSQDTNLAQFCQKYKCSEQDIKKLNPSIPADGHLNVGLIILLPAGTPAN